MASDRVLDLFGKLMRRRGGISFGFMVSGLAA
jgi:hypothetical protein